MIAATCCRCGHELNKKGGVLLTDHVRSSPETIIFNGLEGDLVVKHYVCVSCLKAILEWLKRPMSVRCECGAELAECTQCGVAGEPVGHVECPVAARKAGRVPIASYHVCSLHHGRLTSTDPPTVHVLFEGRALCGFMAGCGAWVSIADMEKQEAGFTPCDRCLSLASASSLSRNRA